MNILIFFLIFFLICVSINYAINCFLDIVVFEQDVKHKQNLLIALVASILGILIGM